MKKYIHLIIFSFLLFLLNSNITYSENFNGKLYSEIYNDYFFNKDYVKEKYNVLDTLLNKKVKLKDKISKCLKFGEKFYGKKRSRSACIIQVKHYVNIIYKNKKYKNYRDLEFNYYNKFIHLYNTPLLQKITKSNKLKKTDMNDISLYINNDGYNKIIIKDLSELQKDYILNTDNKLITNSNYRSYSFQKQLYELYINKYGKNQHIAAVPGSSEHHLGTAIDFKRDKNNYNWIMNNSWKYGFIQSFDNNNCKIKYGIQEERWHYRWVGKKISKIWYSWKTNNKNKCNLDFYYYLEKR